VTPLRALFLGMLLFAAAAFFCPARAHAQAGRVTALTVQTVPVLAGVPFVVGGRTFRTDGLGRARLVGRAPRLADQVRIPETEIAPGVRARFSRRKGSAYLFDLLYRVRISFSDLAGHRIDAGRVTSVSLKGSHGVRKAMQPGGSQWLQGVRVVPSADWFRKKEVTWVVEETIVDGSNVVNRNQQSFVPLRTRHMRIELLFFPAHFSARDAMFDFPLGSGVRIEYPNGRVESHAFGDDSEVTLPSLPRGEYLVSVDGPGISFERPLALSREQTVELEVLSYLDLALSVGVLASIALGLVLVGRPHLARVPLRLGAGLSGALEHSIHIARRRRTRRSTTLEESVPISGRARENRLSKPPTWRDSVKHAAIAALAFGVFVVLLFGRDPFLGALLAVFMFLLFLPLDYGVDKAIYDSRARAPKDALQISRRRGEGRASGPRTRRGP
jgi:hypothetical protein